jgi:hypothetical protein
VNDDQDPSKLKKSKEYKGEDLLFNKVRLRVTPEDFEEPETSEEEPDEEEETFRLDSEPEERGLRKSKRVVART